MMLTALAAAGCASGAGQGGPPAPGANGKDGAVIGIVTAGANSPYYTAMRCGAERAAKEADVSIRWQGTPSTDAREELTVFNSVIATKPDGMILVPWDSEAFIQPTKAYRDSGHPIVTADGTLNTPVDIQNISTNGEEAGTEVARQLVADGLKGTVLVVTHSPGNAVQTARTTGFVAELKSAPGVKVLETQYAGSDASKSASIVAGVITAHADLSLVFVTMDTLGQGAASAIAAAGKTGKIDLIGYDADPKAIEALKSGAYTGIISQNPDFMGYESVKTLAAVLDGSLDPESLEYQRYSPVLYITKENVDTDEAEPFIYSGTCEQA